MESFDHFPKAEGGKRRGRREEETLSVDQRLLNNDLLLVQEKICPQYCIARFSNILSFSFK